MRRLALAAAAVLLLAGCQGADRPVAVASASPTAAATPSATPAPTPTPSASPSPSPSPSPRPVRPPATRSPSPSPSPAARRTAAAVVATCPSMPSTSARQAVLVVASGSSAVIRACERRDGRWVSVLGRAYGHVGSNGVALPGAKREGDLRTPSGVYPLTEGFGVRSDPGVRFSWHRTTTADVWVDDSGSDYYNTRQRKPANGRWDSAEDLYLPGRYDYVQVIGYNTARVPGRGSAIFMHVDAGRSTLGCVAVPRTALLRILRWERPGAVVVIR